MEDSYNIVHWADYDTVGHFAAMEDPETFTAEVQAFLKALYRQYRYGPYRGFCCRAQLRVGD